MKDEIDGLQDKIMTLSKSSVASDSVADVSTIDDISDSTGSTLEGDQGDETGYDSDCTVKGVGEWG